MNQAEQDKRIDYVEFSTTDISSVKKFYGEAFGWEFQDFGPEYTSFKDGLMRGGFQKADSVTPGSPLIVLYAVNLEGLKAAVEAAGGTVTVDMFDFPGGRRFHFRDPVGNELAIWSDNQPV